MHKEIYLQFVSIPAIDHISLFDRTTIILIASEKLKSRDGIEFSNSNELELPTSNSDESSFHLRTQTEPSRTFELFKKNCFFLSFWALIFFRIYSKKF